MSLRRQLVVVSLSLIIFSSAAQAETSGDAHIDYGRSEPGIAVTAQRFDSFENAPQRDGSEREDVISTTLPVSSSSSNVGPEFAVPTSYGFDRGYRVPGPWVGYSPPSPGLVPAEIIAGLAAESGDCPPVYGSGGPLRDVAGGCLQYNSPFALPLEPGDPQPADPDETASPGGSGRRGEPPPPSPEELAALAADRAMALAPEPVIEVAPNQIGLTGLESFFWLAQPPEPITATAGVPGLEVVAEARPVQFVWSFGDGADEVTSDPGRPFTRGRLGSISHLYETKGRYELAVEVVWEARWRTGSSAWQPLGFFTTSASEPYPVREVVSALVSADEGGD